jgi:exodeoxyribonuclease VII large subunit
VIPGGAGLPFDDAPDVRPLSVTELTASVRLLLEDRFRAVTVVGEISNCRPWSSGHFYFTLKDERCQLRAVMFRLAARTLKFRPADGLRVVARGRLAVYDVKGEYQLVCDTLTPDGLGARHAAFEELKRTLRDEGLFEATRKRPLPVLPRRIGVVTSLDGAAVRDVLRILTSRHPGVRVVVRAARVQGPGAADDLVRALTAIVRVPDLDVVIIGRGGGSMEDLWAFNDERLARAIARCPVPVIAAVGHEVDVTIADFVADVRASTPSNAAELVVDRLDNFCARIDRAERRLVAVMQLAQARRRQRLDRLQAGVDRWPTRVALAGRDRDQLWLRAVHAVRGRVARAGQRLSAIDRRLERRDARRVINERRSRLVAADHRLAAGITARHHAAERHAAALGAQLDALSPLGVLARGYAVCWNADYTTILRTAAGVRRGDAVHVTLAEGEIHCRVEAAASRESAQTTRPAE